MDIDVVDLPGNYSLTPYSVEEMVSRDYIVNEHPDVIVNVIDAANIERNLYLTMQMLELGANVVLALNMNKFAEEKGYKIDTNNLSKLLGILVVKIEAVDKTGRQELLETIIKSQESPNIVSERLKYGTEISEHTHALEKYIEQDIPELFNTPSSWTALKLLENDKEVIKAVETTGNQRILSETKKNPRTSEANFR